MLDVNNDHACERRIAEFATLEHLVMVGGGIVVGHDLCDEGELRVHRLEEHASLTLTATGTPCHLRHHLEGTFVGTEIRLVEHRVSCKDSHDADMFEIQALRDHLRTDKDIGAMSGEVVDDLFVGSTGAGGVEIHACDACCREEASDVVLNAFGAEAMAVQVRCLASGTLGRNLGGVAAVVASHAAAAFVQGQRHVAMRASRHPAADVALHLWGIATPVLEEDDLLAAIEGCLHGFQELRRERTTHEALAAQLTHIDDVDLGQLHTSEAFRERDEPVLTHPGVVVAFEGRGGGTQEGAGTGTRGHHDGDVTGVVTWCRILLFEVDFMLFIDDDKAETLERQEDGGAHADNDVIGVVGQLTQPYFGALAVAELAVIDAKAIAEDSTQAVGELAGEHDFGQEVKHLLALCYGLGDEMNVHLGLARRSYAVEKADGMTLPFLIYLRKGGGLCRGEGGEPNLLFPLKRGGGMY